MKAEIIVIGTELLVGRHIDLNSVFLAGRLSHLGIALHYKSVVGDREEDLEIALRSALERSDLILTTGGLGPTADDVTRKVISRTMRRRLIFREELLPEILRKSSAPSRPVTKSAERQALLPARSTVVPNPLGTAPGFILTEEGKTVISLPGVPEEMRRMFDETVRPYIAQTVKSEKTILTRRLRTCGIGESAVDERLRDLLKPRRRTTIGLSAAPTGVDVLVWVTADSADEGRSIMEEVDAAVRKRLESFLYGVDEESMEEIVAKLLIRTGSTLSIAESCTGGLVAHRLTNIPGSSAFFDRGIVCYSNRAKRELLDVSDEVIRLHGAVSRDAARALAEGSRRRAATDLALGVTGIAGPSGGSAQKPVGLVYMALAEPGGFKEAVHHFKGERETIKAQAAQMALDLLRRHLTGL